jgi:hypothetical protein
LSDHINGETGEVIERRALGMPPAIAAAIVAVKKQVRQLGVNERNDHGKYGYVSVDKFYATIGPMMAEAGLALLIDETESEVKEGKSGSPWLFVQYTLAFLHESGVVSAPMRRSLAMPINGPQTYGAAQSYIEKQFLRQVFKIPTGDKDADETAQGDDAPARGRSVPRRQEAAPAPSDAAAEARQQVRELMDAIDATEDPAALSAFAGWPQLTAVEQSLKAAAIPDGDRRETMSMLAGRARKRREQLPGNLEAFNG